MIFMTVGLLKYGLTSDLIKYDYTVYTNSDSQ